MDKQAERDFKRLCYALAAFTMQYRVQMTIEVDPSAPSGQPMISITTADGEGTIDVGTIEDDTTAAAELGIRIEEE